MATVKLSHSHLLSTVARGTTFTVESQPRLTLSVLVMAATDQFRVVEREEQLGVPRLLLLVRARNDCAWRVAFARQL
jgi:hypothetical protein